MAYIESHQDLRTNPKTKRLARILNVHIAQAIGHLHMLWWWALDHAEDGNLGRLDHYDIADAAGWDGNPDQLVDALVECGPGEQHGFLERAASGHLHLHDWSEYTLALRASKEASLRANHVRWHQKRGIDDPSCQFCRSDGVRPESDRSPTGVRPESDRISPRAREESTYLPTYLPTGEDARANTTTDTLTPPPTINNWDQAWAHLRNHIRRHPPGDPDAPPIPDKLTNLITKIPGGMRALRDAPADRAKWLVKDAWENNA